MMAVGFSENYIRLVNPSFSRLGYKMSEILNMQLGEEIVYIPTRDMVIDPVRKAYMHTLEHPNKDLLSQAVDTYADNVRLLGIVYNVTDNKVRIILSRVLEENVKQGIIPNMDVIRYLDFTLTDYERFTYTYMNLNTWNFCNVRAIMNTGKDEFTNMFKCSHSNYNGLFQVMIDLNQFKLASVTKQVDATICTGHMLEEQMFYNLDMDGSMELYARVHTDEVDVELPKLLLNEYLKGRVVTERDDVKVYKLDLDV